MSDNEKYIYYTENKEYTDLTLHKEYTCLILTGGRIYVCDDGNHLCSYLLSNFISIYDLHLMNLNLLC